MMTAFFTFSIRLHQRKQERQVMWASCLSHVTSHSHDGDRNGDEFLLFVRCTCSVRRCSTCFWRRILVTTCSILSSTTIRPLCLVSLLTFLHCVLGVESIGYLRVTWCIGLVSHVCVCVCVCVCVWLHLSRKFVSAWNDYVEQKTWNWRWPFTRSRGPAGSLLLTIKW